MLMRPGGNYRQQPRLMTGFHRTILLVALCLPFLTAACDDVAPGGVFAAQSDRQVDALFADFYKRLGGSDLLGPVISPLFSYGDVSYQYTLAGLMALRRQPARAETVLPGGAGA